MSINNSQSEEHIVDISNLAQPIEPVSGPDRRAFIKTAVATAAGFVASAALSEQASEALTGQQTQSNDLHKDLHAFVGKWNLEQKQWNGPHDASPKVNRGHCECTLMLDGLATLMVTEIPATGYKGVALQTYNAVHQQFELAYVDSNNRQGVLSMVGQPARDPARSELREKFSTSTTQQRVWTTRTAQAACLPQATLLASEAAIKEEPILATAFSNARAESFAPPQTSTKIEVPMRLVENQVSADRWVLEFFLPGPGGKEFLAQQNVFVRAEK
jgi:uncharacterized protein DUF1579